MTVLVLEGAKSRIPDVATEATTEANWRFSNWFFETATLTHCFLLYQPLMRAIITSFPSCCDAPTYRAYQQGPSAAADARINWKLGVFAFNGLAVASQ